MLFTADPDLRNSSRTVRSDRCSSGAHAAQCQRAVCDNEWIAPLGPLSGRIERFHAALDVQTFVQRCALAMQFNANVGFNINSRLIRSSGQIFSTSFFLYRTPLDMNGLKSLSVRGRGVWTV